MTAFPAEFHDRRICMVGLGYVGLTLAVTMAEIGYAVTGVEVNTDAVESLRRGRPHFFEPGLDRRLNRVVRAGQLHICDSMPPLTPADVYVITVGTPLDNVGRVRLDMVERATRQVATVLGHGNLVVIRSTVKLGTTRKVIAPLLASSGRHFDLAFCPERTLEGQAMEELRYLPQIVGATTDAANVRASHLFQFMTPTVVRVADVETAEMIKLVDNAQRDVQFGYANEIARLCDAVGISASEVIAAGKLGYPRTNLPSPGPVGGPCLSKDPYILAQSMEPTGVVPEMTLAARLLNERLPDEVASFLEQITRELSGFPNDPVISILGLAFKGRPATDDLRGTTARPVFDCLRRRFPRGSFRGFDPEVEASKIRDFGLEPHESILSAMRGAHLVVIANNHPELASMPLEDNAQFMSRPGIVYDLWNSYTISDLDLPAGIGYASLGSHGKARLPHSIE